MKKCFLLIILLSMILSSSSNSQVSVSDKLKMYKEVTLTADLSFLSAKEKQIIPILIEVAKIMDDIYWIQAYGDKEKLYSAFTDEDTKKFIDINYGPWERLNDDKPYLEGFGNKPDGANFYPTDMTKEEFEKFGHKDKKNQYTILIRNKNNKNIEVLPYSVAYKDKLTKAAELMKQAAALSEDEGLKKYLTMRAEALLTDNYQPSDFIWMDMKNSNIDFVVGPIENYEDKLFGYKTAFESFVLVKDPDWSKKLAKFTAMLPNLQSGLPVEDAYKKEVPSTESDMNVYYALYYAGDCNSGSKTIAINLPNDEEVQLKKGSRRLQLKNSMQAKFENIMLPISNLLIAPEQRKYVKFDPFFENVTFHEVAHGLGIKNTIDGKSTVRDALKELYGALEERKADILGLYLVTKLYEMGELSSGEVMDNYVTFLAGIFRSCRFGAASAHGKANMMQFEFFKQTGAFKR
ncbi:MAG: Zn-dependent hydrolase, partial [Ignavibacteriae bacterium]|nr:Zn-dependent hydrolase [Ignavibacteriota bacterium]